MKKRAEYRDMLIKEAVLIILNKHTEYPMWKFIMMFGVSKCTFESILDTMPMVGQDDDCNLTLNTDLYKTDCIGCPHQKEDEEGKLHCGLKRCKYDR